MASLLSPGTWRALGGVTGLMFVGLGSAVFVDPYLMSQQLAIKPLVNNPSDPTVRMTKLLGARDLSIGVAICSLWYFEQDKAAGLVILSSMILSAIDIVEVFNAGDSASGLFFTVVASTWGLTGWALWNEG